MSRIGKLPIAIPAGVTVTVSPENVVTVKGPKGELCQAVDPLITVTVEDGVCHVTRPNDEKEARSKHGLYRALIHNIKTFSPLLPPMTISLTHQRFSSS